MGADDRRGLADRAAESSDRVARKELRRDLALRGAPRRNSGQQVLRGARKNQHRCAVGREPARELLRERDAPAAGIGPGEQIYGRRCDRGAVINTA